MLALCQGAYISYIFQDEWIIEWYDKCDKYTYKKTQQQHDMTYKTTDDTVVVIIAQVFTTMKIFVYSM